MDLSLLLELKKSCINSFSPKLFFYHILLRQKSPLTMSMSFNLYNVHMQLKISSETQKQNQKTEKIAGAVMEGWKKNE